MGDKKHKSQRVEQRPAPRRTARPIVAIVGRPNVGKSALFNRLTGSRIAIVEDIPGVTRDRLYADASAFGRDYVLIDTGGFDPESDDPLRQSIAGGVRVALGEADAVICVLDATVDPLPSDRQAIQLLRGSTLPVLYVANKVDNPQRALAAKSLYELGIEHLREISALHGHGIGELEEALIAALPPAPDEPEPDQDPLPRVAIVGRPNAGKSSLVNRLLGEQRQIVDARPGTTIDSVDTLLDQEGNDPLVLIDTAGIRRKRSVEEGLEGLAVMQAIRSIERSGTVLLVVDATEGVAEQDARIAGMSIERGRAVCIALNKMDLLDAEERKKAEKRAKEVLSFMPWAPIKRISAHSGQGVAAMMKSVRAVTACHRTRIPTGAVNRFFEEVLERHPPPTSGGRAVKLYYVTQARTGPPTFVVSTNHPDRVHFSYQRYVANQIRERFELQGTPIRVHYRNHRS